MATKRAPSGRRSEEEVVLYTPTAENINKNVADGTFFRVRGKRSSKNTLSLGGAEKMWEKDPGFIYVPIYNLAGTEEDVASVLIELTQGDREEVGRVLSEAITSRNYNVPVADGGQMENYEQLLRNYRVLHNLIREKRTEGFNARGEPIITLDLLPYIVSELSATQEVVGQAAPRPRTPSRRKVAAPTAPQTKRTNAKSLLTRMMSLPEGKVLDVSAMKEDGSGVRTINIPGPTSGKVGTDLSEIRIVSSNLENYDRALKILEAELVQQGQPTDLSAFVAGWQANKASAPARSRRATATTTPTRGPASPRRTRQPTGGRQLPPLQQQQFAQRFLPNPTQERTSPNGLVTTPPRRTSPRGFVTTPPREASPVEEVNEELQPSSPRAPARGRPNLNTIRRIPALNFGKASQPGGARINF